MCGICGVFSYQGAPSVARVTSMMARLAHRGPDGSGYYRDARVALGHTRLAIVDTVGGVQPLTNEDGTVWITFNGEIFNYVELAQELARLGHRFHTHSDTEVIVHAWEQWGVSCFERFNGQWALAIWDRNTEQLVLSRDRLGVRPLYVIRARDTVAFASEVKALFADPAVTRAIDPVGLEQTLTFWTTVAPRTPFEGVEQLPPGHVAVVDLRGFRSQPYWTPDFPSIGGERPQDLAGSAGELRERLTEATRLRFQRADVPVGAYISGGIDSAVTASVISRVAQVPVHTFSLRFSDPEFDEGPFQQEMARRLGTDHHELTVRPRDIADVFPDVVLHAEAPLLRAAPAPLFLLSRLVRSRGYKVVVTGEGADEVLAGYDIFREARIRQFWGRDPGSAKRARAAELLYPWMVRSPSQAPAFARDFFGRNLDLADPALSHRPRWDSTGAVMTMLAAPLREQMPGDAAERLVATMPSDAVTWDPLSRAQWLEMVTLLPGYILASQGDRMLMANSVEGRFPFLDPNVVEFANSMPSWHKLFGLDEKHVLKTAFEDLVPQSILKRDKQPYRSPDAASFFFGGSPEWLDDVLSRDALHDAGVFNPHVVDRLVAKCRRAGGVRMSNTDNMRLVAVVSTQLLHRQFIEGLGRAGPDSPPEPLTVHDMLAAPLGGDTEDARQVRA